MTTKAPDPTRLRTLLAGTGRVRALPKPKPNPRLYLAGKIGKNDWRHDVVKGLRDAWDYGNAATIADVPSWPVWSSAVLGRVDYVGPYFAGCDHGCAHGQSSHAADGGCVDIRDDTGFWTMRDWVWRQCLRAIDRADVVFAVLDSADCYGTLVELGYARASGKKIVLLVDPELATAGDMWFAQSIATAVHTTGTPQEVLAEHFPPPEQAVQLDSEAERRFWSAYRAESPPALAGLVTQHPVGRYRLDFAVPEQKFGVEIDGYAYHSDKTSFENDRARHRELERKGWRIVRYTGKEACDKPVACVRDAADAAASFKAARGAS